MAWFIITLSTCHLTASGFILGQLLLHIVGEGSHIVWCFLCYSLGFRAEAMAQMKLWDT